MKAGEFLRRVQAAGRRHGVPVRVSLAQGNGSHATLHYGERRTTLKDRRKEVGPGLVLKMLRDLGLTRRDIDL